MPPPNRVGTCGGRDLHVVIKPAIACLRFKRDERLRSGDGGALRQLKIIVIRPLVIGTSPSVLAICGVVAGSELRRGLTRICLLHRLLGGGSVLRNGVDRVPSC